MDPIDETIVKVSKMKVLLLLLMSCVFIVMGVWMTSDDAGGYVFWFFGAISIVFGAAGGMVSTMMLFRKKAGLILNSSGVIDNSSPFSAGLIPWADITGWNIHTSQKQKWLVIKIQDPKTYIERGKRWKQVGNKTNYKLYGSPIVISLNTLKIKPSVLRSMLSRYRIKYHVSVSKEVWYYQQDSIGRAGPFSLRRLTYLLERGDIERDSRVWKDGMPNWLPAHTVVPLAEGLPKPPPSIPQGKRTRGASAAGGRRSRRDEARHLGEKLSVSAREAAVSGSSRQQIPRKEPGLAIIMSIFAPFAGHASKARRVREGPPRPGPKIAAALAVCFLIGFTGFVIVSANRDEPALDTANTETALEKAGANPVGAAEAACEKLPNYDGVVGCVIALNHAEPTLYGGQPYHFVAIKYESIRAFERLAGTRALTDASTVVNGLCLANPRTRVMQMFKGNNWMQLTGCEGETLDSRPCRNTGCP